MQIDEIKGGGGEYKGSYVRGGIQMWDILLSAVLCLTLFKLSQLLAQKEHIIYLSLFKRKILKINTLCIV